MFYSKSVVAQIKRDCFRALLPSAFALRRFGPKLVGLELFVFAPDRPKSLVLYLGVGAIYTGFKKMSRTICQFVVVGGRPECKRFEESRVACTMNAKVPCPWA